ncbi:unnamed protein product [Neospora caninum Liverpool]|uniref:Toxoplasma gondii family A protein n=1 Tax=Neospora caninum (strain Liverpool) TaxID=572307 RepID=F0VRJ0_NEOCL|nr:uncharacterized protein NCLIV_067630 [Neospora caninum Liverpool]CBZ56338.1 unnamed protein product [Neospora caninum Liverpool]CEL71098.1 TPA: hypothetical protein BN1204_067630 [Neospora caninum Liverpool]|eukprot:XP_003886363.1 uncharacterized protein NCLIV_067630 [Neospora caninum Liverpool]
MEWQLFRAVWLALLIGAVLSCVASETSEQKSEADFTITIPKGGLERDVEQVFSLGPSGILQVIDETGKAKYLPEPSTTSDDALSEQYSVAYRFENGECDFTETVNFKDTFPVSSTPFWVREEATSGEDEKTSSEVVKYMFTNPPAKDLGKGLSFCVRFKTVLAAGSDPQTNTSTETPGGGRPEGSTDAENQDTSGPAPELDPEHSSPDGESGSTGPGALPELEQEDQAQKEESGKGENVPSVDSATPNGGAISPAISPEPASQVAIPNMDGTVETTPRNASSPRPDKDDQDLDSDTSEPSRAQLRRLSANPSVKDAFLTVVVHSAAWGLASAMSELSVLLLPVAAALLPTS